LKFENLLESLPESYNLVDREMLTRAYKVAEKAHENQKRVSGEPYITHCLAVAAILNEMKVPPEVVIAGLLHDTVEDTDITLDVIKKEFGDDIAKLVDGVTKLTNLPRVSRGDQHLEENLGDKSTLEETEEEQQKEQILKSRKRDLASETLRKTFLAMGDDIRVVLIKLADRLHNMRTLSYMPEQKRRRIAKETLDIFAPLANRLGIWQMKWELEDLGFRYTNPEKYKEIAEQLAERRVDREGNIEKTIAKLHQLLEQNGIKVEITGRPKHIYSIYKKMMEKGKSFEMVLDLRAVRLIVPDIPSCYAALGVIHTHWRPIPHEFDDYIAAPKDNFYQSLHTAVIFDDGKPLEVQIRTPEMHQNAEYGIAAHWRYKEGRKRDDEFEQRVNWLRRLMDWRKDVDDAQEFMDGMKTDVFQDRVYVFTPRGDIIDLPSGSTPIDFAYHVHTEIGHRCRGAKINGKLVTLDYALKTGDQVEILTAKQGGPSRDWLNSNLGLVNTQRGRAKIKQWFKKQDWDQNVSQGKLQLDRELRRLGLESIDIHHYSQEYEYKNLDDFYEAIGCGDLSLGRLIGKISDLSKEKNEDILSPTPVSEVKSTPDSITVLGLKGMLTSIARCCNPVPGDEIIGYITRGRGATIHRQDCPNILRLRGDQERIVKVSWGEVKHTYPVAVEVKAYDRQGLLGDISSILNNESINLIDISLKVNHNLAVIKLVLDIGDLVQLSRILTRIESLQNVMEVHRLRPG
jgi:GTP diphosphokinase / guanosine-3',5'-bis(diphosphate) 3'-diphosphatase